MACSYFLGIIWHIITKDLIAWDVEEFYDVYQGYITFYTYSGHGFQFDEDGNSPKPMDSMVKVFYYGMTTLTTIGYGDFLPKSVSEKIIISFTMLSGVTVFSFIMSNLIDILNEFQNFGDPSD